MLVKERISFPAVFLIIINVVPLIQFIRFGFHDYSWLIMILANLIIFGVITSYFKERNTKYKSDEKGIIITGSKEGEYDPSFIAWGEIISAEIKHKMICIQRTSGNEVHLLIRKKNRELVLEDIRNGINSY